MLATSVTTASGGQPAASSVREEVQQVKAGARRRRQDDEVGAGNRLGERWGGHVDCARRQGGPGSGAVRGPGGHVPARAVDRPGQ